MTQCIIEARARRQALQRRLRDVEARVASWQITYSATRKHKHLVRLQDARQAAIMAGNEWARADRAVMQLELRGAD